MHLVGFIIRVQGMCYHKGLVSIKKKKEKEPTADIIPVSIKSVNNLTHDACSK